MRVMEMIDDERFLFVSSSTAHARARAVGDDNGCFSERRMSRRRNLLVLAPSDDDDDDDGDDDDHDDDGERLARIELRIASQRAEFYCDSFEGRNSCKYIYYYKRF